MTQQSAARSLTEGLNRQMVEANRRFLRRYFTSLGIFIAIYFACLSFPSLAASIASRTAQFIPSVAALKPMSTESASLSYAYFGVAFYAVPLVVVVLLWNEDVRWRFEYWSPRLGHSKSEVAAIVYLLGMPLLLLILLLAYAAPLDLSAKSGAFGYLALAWMTHSSVGLLVLGTLALLNVSFCLALLVAYGISLPISYLLHPSAGANGNE